MEDVARWLRPSIASDCAVFEAGGTGESDPYPDVNDINNMPKAKVYKVSCEMFSHITPSDLTCFE